MNFASEQSMYLELTDCYIHVQNKFILDSIQKQNLKG